MSPRLKRYEEPGALIILCVWQKFHLLNRTQVFVVSAVSSAILALSVALASVPEPGTSMNRFFGPPRQFDPWINLGLAFVVLLPIFLGYYHRGWAGAILSLAASAVSFYIAGVTAALVFTFGLAGWSVVAEGIVYGGVCLFLAILVFTAHSKISRFPSGRTAQQRVLPTDDLSRYDVLK
jgi:hypothetical protein